MLEFFKKPEKHPAGPSAHDGESRQELLVRVALLEARLQLFDDCLVKLCYGVQSRLERIEDNIRTLDNNMHTLASMTIRPPTDMLGGGQETN